MNATTAIIRLDIRGIARDQVMLINVVLSAATMVVITVLGVFQHAVPGWVSWFPFMIALALVSGPGGFGYLFGLLMVDETDSGVRDALSITPVTPARLLLTRTSVATLWMCLWPLFTVAVMNSTWRVLDVSAAQWIVLVLSLALLTPVCALAIPTLAKDKVEALAVFKGITFVTLAPLAMYFIAPDAAYRPIFLVIPTAWAIEAFDAFVAGDPLGYAWAAGGGAYALVLLVAVVQLFRRRVYRLERDRRGVSATRARRYIGGALLGGALVAAVSALSIPLLDLPVGRTLAVAAALIVVAKLLGAAAFLVLGREVFARIRSKLFNRQPEPRR